MRTEHLAEYFRTRVSVAGDGCWLWSGYIDQKGYGISRRNGKTQKAHRAVYAALVGPLDPSMQIDHLCRVRHCVNPSHLEQVTCGENVRRGTVGGVNRGKTHCHKGHEYTLENTYRRGGKRYCRQCMRDNYNARYRGNEAWREKRKQACRSWRESRS